MNADDPEIRAPGRGGATRPASAGMLLFRRGPGGGDIEVLLVHPGGPFWANKDAHAWSIPKGEIGPDESPLAAALRELDALDPGDLDGYHLFHAARADLLRRLGRPEEAATAYNAAIERAGNETERSFLIRQRDSLD